jgi:SAM-dependent MidA family methyltransferase
MSDVSLEAFLRRQILASGPMPLSEFMRNAVATYYSGSDPFGRQGDFITAPEISQMFGEIIGLWAAVLWQKLGSPERVILAELGPGRGTLMADLLRAAETVPEFRQAIALYLVETSESLRARQKQTLGAQPVNWIDDITALPQGPTLLIANEFFDALPIDQYVWRFDHWHERWISCRNEQFCFVDGPKVSDRLMAELGAPEAKLGDIFEVNKPARDIAAHIGRRFREHQGAALIIDYGHDQ